MTEEGRQETQETPEELLTRRRAMVLDSLNSKRHRIAPVGASSAQWHRVSEKLQHELVEALVRREWPILLFGPTGRGKSCAMACVYMALPIEFMTLWFDTGELLQRVMECRQKGHSIRETQSGFTVTESEFDIKRKIKSADYVFFDDVGVKAPTETQRAAFEEIVNLREGKPTIYSTNKTAAEMADLFDMRIVSRIFRGTPINVKSGDDRRLVGQKIREV